jgi:hypothetical protein
MTKLNEHQEFLQPINTKRIYNVDHHDGSVLPVVSKPIWTLVHYNADGSPSQSIGTLETSPDGGTGRLTTGHLPGTIEITVSASVSPTAVATKTFKINVAAHQPVTTRSPTFRVSQHRNGPTH